MEGPLLRLHILSRSIKKYGRHRLFLFLIGQFEIFIVFITTFILWMNLLLEIRNTNAVTLKETTARQLEDCTFCPDPLRNMAATGYSCF
jgi:hypothetical protein